MRRLALAAALLTAFAGEASAAEGDPVTEPVWAAQPAEWWAVREFPVAAARRRLPGRATIRCRVDSVGLLNDCKVLDESPSGAGFGPAAVVLSKGYRVAMKAKGAPAVGQAVVTTIAFTPPGFARVVEADSSSGPRVVRWVSARPPGYPIQARFSGLSGRVVVRCTIGPKGALSGCISVSEQPTDLGFGPAAVQSRNRARVSGKTQDGAPAEGLTIETEVITNPACTDRNQQDARLNGCAPDFQPFHPGGIGR